MLSSSFRRTRAAIVSLGLLITFIAPSVAEAGQYRLTFAGFYDLTDKTLFGQTGPAVPFTYTLDYDTALDTNTDNYPTGSVVGGRVPLHPFVGYSKSGFIAASLTFGDMTFDPATANPLAIAVGAVADLWLDADLATGGIPTRAWALFSAGTSDLSLGQGRFENNLISLDNTSRIEQFDPTFEETTGPMTVTVAPLPEPATLSLLALASGAMLLRRRRI